MASITFIAADGRTYTLDIANGMSVMEGAVRGAIEGIEADCGGAGLVRHLPRLCGYRLPAENSSRERRCRVSLPALIIQRADPALYTT
jgi:2Fe-2S ferredoxin